MPVVQMRDAKGKFLSHEKLRMMFEAVGASKDRTIVTYCTSGIQASVGAFAFQYAGFENVRLYDNSWSEFGSLEETKDLVEVVKFECVD